MEAGYHNSAEVYWVICYYNLSACTDYGENADIDIVYVGICHAHGQIQVLITSSGPSLAQPMPSPW